MTRNPERCILFDWGDTLMRDYMDYTGPMKDWPRLEALPGAVATLTRLRPDWLLALATNAADSAEADIRLALQRVDLDRLLDRIYCIKNVGFRKPSPEFFRNILDDLGLAPRSVCMVGDNFEVDVLGANRSGLPAVWLNELSLEEQQTDLHVTIHDLNALPAALQRLLTGGWKEAIS